MEKLHKNITSMKDLIGKKVSVKVPGVGVFNRNTTEYNGIVLEITTDYEFIIITDTGELLQESIRPDHACITLKQEDEDTVNEW